MARENPETRPRLPEIAIQFLKSRGMVDYDVICEDGRSYIVLGVNDFMGELRVFICRIYRNGYVRDYIALPFEYSPKISGKILGYWRRIGVGRYAQAEE